MAEFPLLIGDSSTGKAKLWQIKVKVSASTPTSPQEPARVVLSVTHGYKDGKMQVNEKIISTGKNIGRENETTPLQQAIQDARTQWLKKKDSGYTELHKDAESVVPEISVASRNKKTSTEVPSAMLAHDFNKHSSSMSFPCYIQRKYDGTRCIAVPQVGLFSRNKKQYPHMEHISEDIRMLPPCLVLDGELYSDSMTFQETVGLVKRQTLKDGDSERQLKIRYHVYDIISDAPYEDRYARLQALFDKFKFKYLTLVRSELCSSTENMKARHNQYVKEGYEGAILRNKKGPYKIGYRSTDLQKYKEFTDEEYVVVGYKEGEGLDQGCVIWSCRTTGGAIFSCRPRGTKEDRTEMFVRGDEYIGKNLTVRFQELNDDGIPRFPVGISFRDYE